MLNGQCTWPWGHCLLFELGQAPTPRLAVIMGKRELVSNDNRRSLYKKNPVASAGNEEKSPGWRELEESAKEKKRRPRLEWKGRKDDERQWRWRIGVI
ncbi:hypothetical protein TNCV_1070521 [Trichonephila clavipes]|nr:hypothetical protein TNCV_1070521 [Trichonephila clavipes]